MEDKSKKLYGVSPGEFKSIIDAIAGFPITLTLNNGCIEIKNKGILGLDDISFDLGFKDEFPEIKEDQILPIYTGSMSLKTLVDMIPPSTLRKEMLLTRINERSDEFDEINATIPWLDISVDDHEIIFYLSFDYIHDICMVKCPRKI